MRREAGIAALCLAALALIAQGVQAEEVVTLNGEEAFDKAVAESTFLVAEFYAPWCGTTPNLWCGCWIPGDLWLIVGDLAQDTARTWRRSMRRLPWS